jgi:hypothetical protein
MRIPGEVRTVWAAASSFERRKLLVSEETLFNLSRE